MAPLHIATLKLMFFHHALLALQRKKENKTAVGLEMNLEFEANQKIAICKALLD